MRNSCISYRAHSRKNVLHEDLLEICDGNMLAALILSDLIYWTDIKRAQHQQAITEAQATGKTADPLNLWIWKSHDDFQDDLMFDKAGMKKPHRTTIAGAIKLLEDKKFIQKRRNPRMALDRTFQYLFLQEATQKAINALAPIVEKPTMESRKTDNALSKSQQSLSENDQCNAEKPTSNTIRLLTEITDPEITEESVCGESPTSETPAREGTHTRISNSSSSEQVAETTAPTQQARSSAEPAMSASDAPRTPTSPSVSPTGVRGVFPQDDNMVGTPPAEDKSQVNRQENILRRQWADRYLPRGYSKEIILNALELHKKWIETYGQYGDADWDKDAFIWFAQNGGKDVWGNIQKVRSCMTGRKRNPDRVKSEWGQLEEQSTPSTPQNATKTLLPPRPKTRAELKKEPY